MCVDYTDLNRACPKYAYPLPIIDKLVDNSSGYKLFSFMDPYSGYNQITKAKDDKEKKCFHDQIRELSLLRNALQTKKRKCHLSTHDEQGIQQRTSGRYPGDIHG